MLRASRLLSCAVVGASTTTGAGAASFEAGVSAFLSFMKQKGATYDGVLVRPTPEECRGLVATTVVREGTTLMSVPLHTLGISSERLLSSSEHLRRLSPPNLDDVRRLMTARSILDPVLYEQVHLALLLAAEHMNPESALNPYLNILPHPAMDDAAVIRKYKDAVDPMWLVEWDDYQKEFLAVLHILLRRWGPQAPPVELAYWALRTVFSRMHMLPSHGLAPEDVGSTLNYTALSTVDLANRQTKWMRRIKGTFGSLMGNLSAAEEYRLVPTLVPLIDMTPHLPSTNVQVEVGTRPGVGSCVELKAIREIEKGEPIGMRFNTTQSPAFLLYRFGFIPQ